MGEGLFRRLFVLILLVSSFVVFSVGVFAAVHPLYSGFSSANSGFVFNNASSLVSVSDTVVYRVGYYSINGNSWQSFTLAGTAYNGNTNWLSSSTSYTLPVFGIGEHYIIVYSCTYNAGNISWNCHDNKWQLIIINNSGSSCEYSVCSSDEYCFAEGNICLLNVSRETYFVSTTGNDNNTGTFTQPWKTWSKAFHTAQAGDIVYFRGGTYNTEVTDGTGIKYIPAQNLGYDGTEANPVRYFNYPNETPILDCSLSVPSAPAPSWNIWNYGIYLYGVDYVHIKGLHVRNLFQRNRTDGSHDIAFAVEPEWCNHLTLENMAVYNIHGVAVAAGDNHHIELINCDAYNNNDIYAAIPGDYGMGLASSSAKNFSTGYTYMYGCRAWNNSDMGFVSNTYSHVVFDNCWSFYNGDKAYPGGDGVGWKIGYWYSPMVHEDAITIKNCIAANNKRDGMAGNEHDFAYTSSYILYNNFIYNNGRFGIAINNVSDTDEYQLRRTCKNNIAYSNKLVNVNAEGLYTHNNNSWDSPVTMTADDFVSLDVSQLYLPRKADGSLPDITFGHLKAGSDLIDAGVVIPGYQCSTAGAHTGEDCVEWYGLAPDLGPFELNY